MEAKVTSKKLNNNNLEISIDIDLIVSTTIEPRMEKLELTENSSMSLKDKGIILNSQISNEEKPVEATCVCNAPLNIQYEKLTPELLVEGPEKSHLTEMKSDFEEGNCKRIIETIEIPTQRFLLEASENELRIPVEDQETVNNDSLAEADSANLVRGEVVMEVREALQVVEIQENGDHELVSEAIESLNNEETSDCQERLQGSFLDAIHSNKLFKNICGFFRYFLGVSILIIVIVIIVKFYYALRRDFNYHGTKF